MVVCQYFLQGRCHFGQNCRNEHIYNNNPDNRSGRQQGGNQLDNVIWQISNEVLCAEKGGQWPLSSFAPIKEGSCLPWWEDISPEEVRWTLYEAQKNGTVNQALNQINQWYKKAENARNLLKHPTAEVINVLNNILKGKKTTQPNATTSGSFTSSGNDPKSTFRFDTSVGNIFSQPATSASNSGNIFGKPATSGSNSASIFGGSSGGFQTQNIFGQSGQSLTPASTSNIFSRPQQTSQNIFSSPGNSASNIFSGQASGQPFPNANVTGQNIFQNQNPTNAFSAGSPAFGVASPVLDSAKGNTNIFGTAQNNPFQFQNPGTSHQVETNTVKTDNTNFSNPLVKDVDFSVYSKMEDLNESDMKSFNSTTFTFGNIPQKPPPQQFC